MIKLLKIITDIVNYCHDKLVLLAYHLGLHFNDVQLHFLVIGFLGMILYILVNQLFRYLVRYSLSTISFIYTFTVLVVIVFAIEIEQKLTGHGHMEFQDIVGGLWGFSVAFSLYIAFRFMGRWLKRYIRH